MTKLRGKCLNVDIEIHDDRQIVECDGLEFPFTWKEGDGYFLVRLHEGQICAAYVDGQHQCKIEFRGTDPEPMTKEIVSRDFLTLSHTSYIGGELILAHHCLVNDLEYVQR